MMAHERDDDSLWEPLRQGLEWQSRAAFRGLARGPEGAFLLEPPEVSECRDYNVLEKVASIKMIMITCLAVIAMEGCLSRRRQISSYLPVDKASACFFLVGAAQRANTESLSGPVLLVGEQAWWCGLLVYFFVCFKLLGRKGRTILELTGFVLLSRWEMDVKLGVAVCLAIGLLASADKKLPSRGDCTPSPSVSDRVKVFEEVVFRFAALTVVLICYPHIKFDEVTTPSGTYPGELSHHEYALIGEVVRVGVSQPDCGKYKGSAFAIILYGRVFGTSLFKVCQASMAYLMARILVTLPVFLGVFPRCKCALATITTSSSISSSASSAGLPDRTTKAKHNYEHKEEVIEQPGDGHSKEDVSLRIQLRSMHRSLAAALVIVAIDYSMDSYARLRNEQRGLCISGEDYDSYAGLHERLLRDLEEVTTACFAMFAVAITRGAQEELAFVLALYGPSRDRDLLKYFSSALAGTAAVVLCLFGGILPYAMLVGIPPFTFGRSYGTAVSMTYFELMISIGLTVLPCWNLFVSFVCGRQIFPLPQWFEDAAIVASTAYAYDEVLAMRTYITTGLSNKLVYFPVSDKALWVPWNIGKSQGILEVLPKILLLVYQWCSLFEIGVDAYRLFWPFCWPTSRQARLGLVSRDGFDRAGGKEMICPICAKSLVDQDGGFTPGPFKIIPASPIVDGGISGAAAQTCFQSRCRCKRFLHAGCAATWLKISPECPMCPEYLHGGLDLWKACSVVLAFVVPKPIPSLVREAWWFWTESGLVLRQKAAIYLFGRHLAWSRKEHVMHREYMVAFRKLVHSSLELRDRVKANETLLQNTKQELHKLEKTLEAVQATTKTLVATLDEKKTLMKKSLQPGKKKKAARHS